MMGEEDGFVGGKEFVKVPVRKTVGMFFLGLKGHQVDDVDHADLQIRYEFPEQSNGCKGLH